MLNFSILIGTALVVYYVTSIVYRARINSLMEQLRIARNKIVFREIAETNLYRDSPGVFFCNSSNSWDVVLGRAPYRFVVASYPCGDDPEAAKALAEELAETIVRFRLYGAD